MEKENIIILFMVLMLGFVIGWFLGEREYSFNDNMNNCLSGGGRYAFSVEEKVFWGDKNYELCEIEEMMWY